MARYTASNETCSYIAALVEQQRPDWDAGLVKVILLQHAPLVDGTDLAIAALRASLDLNLPGPKAIGWRGPHWRDLETCPPEAARPKRCGVCGRLEPQCYTVRHGDDDHRFEPTDSLVRSRR